MISKNCKFKSMDVFYFHEQMCTISWCILEETKSVNNDYWAGSATGTGMINCIHQSTTLSIFCFETTSNSTNVINWEFIPVLKRWSILITFLTSAKVRELLRSVLLQWKIRRLLKKVTLIMVEKAILSIYQ